jgi:hypothetical protein
MTNHSIYQEQWDRFMTRQKRTQQHEERQRLRDHKFQVEDERGWSGQHGQCPRSAEEWNYRPNQGGDTTILDKDWQLGRGEESSMES